MVHGKHLHAGGDPPTSSGEPPWMSVDGSWKTLHMPAAAFDGLREAALGAGLMVHGKHLHMPAAAFDGLREAALGALVKPLKGNPVLGNFVR